MRILILFSALEGSDSGIHTTITRPTQDEFWRFCGDHDTLYIKATENFSSDG